MTGYSISPLELCRIIEEAFLPARCVCTSPDGTSLNVQLYQSATHTHPTAPGQEEPGFSVVGIPIAGLGNSRAIARLVMELREESQNGPHAGFEASRWQQSGL